MQWSPSSIVCSVDINAYERKPMSANFTMISTQIKNSILSTVDMGDFKQNQVSVTTSISFIQ